MSALVLVLPLALLMPSTSQAMQSAQKTTCRARVAAAVSDLPSCLDDEEACWICKRPFRKPIAICRYPPAGGGGPLRL